MKSKKEHEIHNSLLDFSPSEFEHFVAKVWKNMGWEVDVTSKSRDNGVDILATKSGIHDEKAAIQAKKYAPSNKIGQPSIQQYDTLRRQDSSVDLVVVVTTSEFTSNARDLAKRLNVKLINGTDIVKAALDNIDEEKLSDLILASKDSETQSSIKTSKKENGGQTTNLSSTLSIILERDKLTHIESEIAEIYKDHWKRGSESRYNGTPDSYLVFEFQNGPEDLEVYQVLVGLHSIEFNNKQRWERTAKTAKKYHWEIDSKKRQGPGGKSAIGRSKEEINYLLNLIPDEKFKDEFSPKFEARFTSVVLEKFLDSSLNEVLKLNEVKFGNSTETRTHELNST